MEELIDTRYLYAWTEEKEVSTTIDIQGSVENFSKGYWLQLTSEEGLQVKWLKCCDYNNNQNMDTRPKIQVYINDNFSSQKSRQKKNK